MLLVKQLADRCQNGCCLLSIHNQKAIEHWMFTVHSSRFRWEAHFVLLRQQPYIQNRKSIPTYKINTLTYVFCFWQFVIQVRIVACTGRFVSEFAEGTILAVELVVKYFATAHLFIININSVFEEVIRWSDGDPFFRCLELSFHIAISSVAEGKRIRAGFLHVLQ